VILEEERGGVYHVKRKIKPKTKRYRVEREFLYRPRPIMPKALVSRICKQAKLRCYRLDPQANVAYRFKVWKRTTGRAAPQAAP
jgi:hypothetical protein